MPDDLRQTELFMLASKICNDLMNWSQEAETRGEVLDYPPVWADFAYAEALLHLREHPDPRRVFVLEHRDPFFYHFRQQLRAKYGLAVFNREEAPPGGQIPVCGMLDWICTPEDLFRLMNAQDEEDRQKGIV